MREIDEAAAAGVDEAVVLDVDRATRVHAADREVAVVVAMRPDVRGRDEVPELDARDRHRARGNPEVRAERAAWPQRLRISDLRDVRRVQPVLVLMGGVSERGSDVLVGRACPLAGLPVLGLAGDEDDGEEGGVAAQLQRFTTKPAFRASHVSGVTPRSRSLYFCTRPVGVDGRAVMSST